MARTLRSAGRMLPARLRTRADARYAAFAGGRGYDAQHQHPGKPLYRNGKYQCSVVYDSHTGYGNSIQLDYHASGIKVQDFATWVGLGWRLSVPASITRTAKRGYDEGGFMAGDGDLVRNGEWNEALFDQKIDVCDGEADLFYFEIPGKSGTMVWSPKKKQFYTVPYQNLKIDCFSSYNTFLASSA
ncbi:MAG: hypothetical protein ACLR8Y_15925 [Alistipes indistinctus]